MKEQNKLIAEFMGYETDNIEVTMPENFREVYRFESAPSDFFSSTLFKLQDCKFHSSWDWLMPVVEKIESLGHGVTIYRKGCHINNEASFSVNGFKHSSKIEQTYKAVVEFINWYNQQNQDQ